MDVLREWWRRLLGSLIRRRGDHDIEAEMRAHFEFAAEEARRRGLPPEEAERAARLRAGGLSQAMDAMRDQRGLPWLDDFTRDTRHAVRSLRRTPLFTAIALLTLGLGIGANTSVFSIVNGVILQPLPYSKPEQLMHLTAEFPAAGRTEDTISILEYLEFRRMNQSFEEVGAYTTGADVYTTGEVNLLAGDRPLRVRSISVDAHLLNALGIQPAHGRLFNEQEISFETRGLAAPVAILSHELWQSALGGQALIGQTVNIDGRPHEIVGIMLPGADIIDNHTEVWLPLGFHREFGRNRSLHVLHIAGRLKDGVTQKAAQEELNALLENWGERAGVSGHVPRRRPERAGDHTIP